MPSLFDCSSHSSLLSQNGTDPLCSSATMPGDMLEANEIFDQLTAVHSRLINCESYLTKLHITYTAVHSTLQALLLPFKYNRLMLYTSKLLISLYETAKMDRYPEPYKTPLTLTKEALEFFVKILEKYSKPLTTLRGTMILLDEVREDAQNLSNKVCMTLVCLYGLMTLVN